MGEKEYQIMISFHCDSMGIEAEQLRMFLEDHGFSVFICTEMKAGTQYRELICSTASKCQVFVTLINEGWCKSGECLYEFNIALSDNIKTHKPHIIPVLFEDFTFYAQHSTVAGFLKNQMGIQAKLTAVGVPLWYKVLESITAQNITPLNTPRHPPPNDIFHPTQENNDEALQQYANADLSTVNLSNESSSNGHQSTYNSTISYNKPIGAANPTISNPPLTRANKPASPNKPIPTENVPSPINQRGNVSPSNKQYKFPLPADKQAQKVSPRSTQQTLSTNTRRNSSPVPPAIAPIQASTSTSFPQTSKQAASGINPNTYRDITVSRSSSPGSSYLTVPTTTSTPRSSSPSPPPHPPVATTSSPPSGVTLRKMLPSQGLNISLTLPSSPKMSRSPSPRLRSSSQLSNIAKSLAQPAHADLSKLKQATLLLLADLRKLDANLVHINDEIHTILEDHALPLEKEPALIVLMDYLTRMKETLSSANNTLEQYNINEMVGTAKKLLTLLQTDPIYSASEFILESETRTFWDKCIGKAIYSATYTQFVHALGHDPNYSTILNNLDIENLKDLPPCIDRNNSGYIICHRLSDFVGMRPLSEVLREFLKPRFPLLLWIDSKPSENEQLTAFAYKLGINVKQFNAFVDAKNWIERNSDITDTTDTRRVRVITHNARTSTSLNAGEEVIRFIRGRRSAVPILVYCRDLAFAQYVTNFQHYTRATNEFHECQRFIEEMVAPNMTSAPTNHNAT